jgi:hypothetical protein
MLRDRWWSEEKYLDHLHLDTDIRMRLNIEELH